MLSQGIFVSTWTCLIALFWLYWPTLTRLLLGLFSYGLYWFSKPICINWDFLIGLFWSYLPNLTLLLLSFLKNFWVWSGLMITRPICIHWDLSHWFILAELPYYNSINFGFLEDCLTMVYIGYLKAYCH